MRSRQKLNIKMFECTIKNSDLFITLNDLTSFGGLYTDQKAGIILLMPFQLSTQFIV